MARTPLKTTVYGELARFGKALSAPIRVELLELISQGERSVEQLAHEIEQSVANTSKHLQVLRAARLVEGRKHGTSVYQRVADPEVLTLIQTLRKVGERRSAEIATVARKYLDGRDELEPVSRAELKKRLRDGTVTLIDVRPWIEFDSGHIPGAISIPVPVLRNRVGELPKGREVVAYCRGPYCVMALEAVEVLRKAGRRARRLEEGFPEWRAEGLPVETGEPVVKP